MAKIIDLRGKVMGGRDKRSKINKIARHHSATKSGDAFTFQRHWSSLGWRTGGYHEIILPDGSVQLCYDSNVVTNGVYGHNKNTYHICLVGNGSFTDAQEKAFEKRAKKAIKRFGLSVSDVLGHGEFKGASTACPGTNMNTVRDRLRGKATTTIPYTPKPAKKPSGKSISQMAAEVIAGKHGDGHANRRKSLGISQSEYNKVRAEVNRGAGASTKPKSSNKSIGQMAQEVIDGKHGNGHEKRRNSLGITQAKYNKVRDLVNKRAGKGNVSPSGKSISLMATEVIQGKHGSGHANRRRSLGISRAQYNKVRAEVNKRM